MDKTELLEKIAAAEQLIKQMQANIEQLTKYLNEEQNEYDRTYYLEKIRAQQEKVLYERTIYKPSMEIHLYHFTKRGRDTPPTLADYLHHFDVLRGRDTAHTIY